AAPDGPVHVYGLRKFPYPYQAMLAIASDADHATLRKFILVHQFLNTREQTPLGPGLGLDISDSCFMYNGSDIPGFTDAGAVPMSQMMTYFQGVSAVRKDADALDAFIHCGWIDSLHTFGDFSRRQEGRTLFTRALASQALQALAAHGDRISVWIDHGNAANVDNFGAYGVSPFYNYQQGANPRSPYYHTDETVAYGIHFVWADLHSSVFGRDSVIYPIRLPSGQKVWGFWRYTDLGRNAQGQVQWVWDPYNLSRQLTETNLENLESKHQYAVLAQHLTGGNDWVPLPPDAVASLQRLADHARAGKLLVARTSRLLQYNVSQQYVRYQVNGRRINIVAVEDPVLGTHIPTLEELRGLTFYVDNPAGVEIAVNQQPLPDELVQRNPNDGQHPSVGIRWFPEDTHDYSALAYQPPGFSASGP
ncbi:MAG: hypothetical protein K6T31_02030, partial [Alicyclobacillus sp.]|nr:hypothetical protein [Alicyclobacillus sp.]